MQTSAIIPHTWGKIGYDNMTMIDDSLLFIRVAQAGSLTNAASKLDTSKSQISRRISNLEKALNTTLFLRTPRGLQLTELGQQYYQSCLSIQEKFDQAQESLLSKKADITGNIAITAPMSLGSLLLGPVLAKFMSQYPDVTIELDLTDNARPLTESHFDLAIRAASKLPDSNLRAKILRSYDYVIAASPMYLSQYGEPKTPEELSKHRAITCITTADKSLQNQWPFEYQGQSIVVNLNRVAKVTHMWVQKQFALEGVGVIRVPRYWVDEEMKQGSLCPLLSAYMTAQSNLFAVYKNMPHTPKRIKALINYLGEKL